MADEADLAVETEGRLEALVLASLLRPRPRGVSASHCTDCGDEIPEARRVAVPGCYRCAECAGLAERRELIRKRTGR